MAYGISPHNGSDDKVIIRRVKSDPHSEVSSSIDPDDFEVDGFIVGSYLQLKSNSLLSFLSQVVKNATAREMFFPSAGSPEIMKSTITFQ